MLRSVCATAAVAAVVLAFAATAPAANEPQVAAGCPSVTTTAPFSPPGGLPAITINIVKPVLTEVLPGETCDNYPYIPVWADQPTTIPYGSTTRVWYWIEQGHAGGTCYQEGGWGFDRQITLDGSGSYGSSGAPIGTTVGPFDQAGSFTFTVVCPQSAYGPGNQNTVTITVSPPTQPPPPPPPPPPSGAPPKIASFTASNSGPWSGNSISLSWNSNGAACRISSNPSGGSNNWGALAASGTVGTPTLSSGPYTYTLACSNSYGTTTKQLGVGVFDSNEQMSDDAGSGTDLGSRQLSGVSCRWFGERNENTIKTRVGLVGGGIGTEVGWCVSRGYIRDVRRTVYVISPNYPLAMWNFNGYTSYGPCDETCSNYVSQYGTKQTRMNIWAQGHWSLCMSIPILGSLCAQQAYLKVGVLIRGDGSRVDTY